MKRLLLTVANLLIPIAVWIFATGFFPYKPFVPGLASYEDHELLGAEYGVPPERQFDRLVFMVVDALRSDFVFSSASGFGYTQKLIREGEAVPFTAHATSPTITMPRVKAMTTGSIPSFLDVILNFAESDTTSSLANQDTWLAQIKAGRSRKNDGSLLMYGDDTWLKLFPDTFARADGTTSFFVSDFTEVDLNVTRHVPRELDNEDWDAMIMHYLGLDHIGHKAGPTSPNMILKHMEMDAIVQQIYQAMLSKPHLNSTLFVLLGDHGMTEVGNHGGSSPGETSPALVFISPKLKTLSSGRKCPVTPHKDFDYYVTMEQSDLVPTISGLLGYPVPLNNLGVFIPDFLALWKNPVDQLQILLRNALQILPIVKTTFPGVNFDNIDSMHGCDTPSSDPERLACKWKLANQILTQYRVAGVQVRPTLTALYEFCKEAQDVMSSTASNYDISRLVIGTGLAAASLMLAAVAAWKQLAVRNVDGLIFVVITALYGVMMFASSYVEEEQHFWYWLASGWFAYLRARSFQRQAKAPTKAARSPRLADVAVLFTAALHRILTHWNQTGQKHAGAPDIVHSVLLHHPVWLWALVGLTYLAVAGKTAKVLAVNLRMGFGVGTAAALVMGVSSLAFKVMFTANDAPELLYWLTGDSVEWLQQLPAVPIARFIFTMLFAAFALLLLRIFHPASPEDRIGKTATLQTVHILLTHLLLAQSRTPNLPLFLLFHLQLSALSTLALSPLQAGITSTILAHASFFALGGSNAISSIDLSNAYNGVAGYNVLAVGALLFVGNWAGPMWWSLGGLTLSSSSSSFTPSPSPSSNPLSTKPRSSTPKSGSSSATDDDHGGGDIFLAHASLSTLFASGSLAAVMLACALLRTHLFVWTVFSPKYLYAMAWVLGWHGVVQVGIVGGVLGLAGLAARR